MSSKRIAIARLIRRLTDEDLAALTLDEMVAAGRYDKVSKWLPEAGFPIRPERFTNAGAKLHHYGKFATPHQIEERLAEDGRELCYLETLLAHGRYRPHDQRRFPIIGRSYDGLVPYLTGDARERNLYLGLHSTEGGYGEICRFLSVPIAARSFSPALV